MAKWIKDLNQEDNKDNKVNHHVFEPIIDDVVIEDEILEEEE